MEIQRLGLHEAERLRAVRLRALTDAPDAFGSTFAQWEGRKLEAWTDQLAKLPTFVAVVGGSDVGMVRAAPDAYGREAAWLISMWVGPEARGQGVGEALVSSVAVWARSQGFDRVLLDVADQNGPAIALYERLGFVATGETGALPAPRDHILEHRRALRLR